MTILTDELRTIIDDLEDIWNSNMSSFIFEEEHEEVLDLLLNLQMTIQNIEKDIARLEKGEPMRGYAYLMRYSTGFYKIGFSNKPPRRRTEKVRDQQGLVLEVNLIHAVETDDMVRLEKDIARLFDLSSKHIGDEMWDLNQDDIDKFCSVRNVFYGDTFAKGIKIF